jgi:heat shock protein beta
MSAMSAMMTAAAARVPASATRPTAFRRSTQSKHAHPPVALSSKHRRLTSVIVRAEAATEEAPSAGGADGETYEYQAEVNRLLDLIVNSLYSNRDVFLRELVSNASDALDKLRFTAVSNQDVMAANGEMKMQIKGDPVAKTLVIEDTGIGMTREDLVSSLGTIGEQTFLFLRNCNYFNPPYGQRD